MNSQPEIEPESQAEPAEEPQLDAAANRAAELEKYKDAALRARADLDNYRKRVAREKEDAIRYANNFPFSTISSLASTRPRMPRTLRESFKDLKWYASSSRISFATTVSRL